MRAGPLDRRIVIERRTLTRNTEGAAIETWGTFATVWAKKEDLSGDEVFAGDKEVAKIVTRWTIRQLTGLKNEMRIIYAEKIYDILDIEEIGRGDGHAILSEARPE